VKTSNAFFLAVIIFLCQCHKDSEQPKSNETIVLDNAQAALYFHTIFRESEYAWALMDSLGYRGGSHREPANPMMGSKLLIFNLSEKTLNVDVQYDAWLTHHLRLTGTISLTIDTCSYRTDAKEAKVKLSDFSINGQAIVGESSIKYRKVANNTNDHYTFTLFDGTVIYEAGVSMPVLITSTISNGQYERIKGSETWKHDDDVWAFSGVMTGMLHDDPNLKFTNTVTQTQLINGESADTRVYYSMDCKFGSNGLSQIKIAKRPDIYFGYGCTELYFETVTQIK